MSRAVIIRGSHAGCIESPISDFRYRRVCSGLIHVSLRHEGEVWRRRPIPIPLPRFIS